MFNKYIVASARIRALESRALWQKDIERMLNAKTAKDAFNVLQDNCFSEHLSWVMYKDFENVLTRYLNRVKKTVTLSCPSCWVIGLISIWYDYYNIKIALKSFLKWEDFDNVLDNLSTLWNIQYKDIKDFAYEWGLLSENFNKLRTQIMEDYSDKNNLQRVDILCDKWMFKDIFELSKRNWSELISNFYKKRADVINTMTYLRNKENYDWELFIEWWDLSVQTLLSWNYDEINRMFNFKLWLDISTLELSSYATIWAYVNKVLIWVLEQAKYVAYWQEVIFAFFWDQVIATEIIRSIMVWKINHLSYEEIQAHITSI